MAYVTARFVNRDHLECGISMPLWIFGFAPLIQSNPKRHRDAARQRSKGFMVRPGRPYAIQSLTALIQESAESYRMEIKWHDIDPDTGKRRYLGAQRFGGVWSFRWKLQKRGDWTRGLEPTRAMWEFLVDALERRYWRREGVEEKDIKQVKKLLAEAIRAEEIPNAQ